MKKITKIVFISWLKYHNLYTNYYRYRNMANGLWKGYDIFNLDYDSFIDEAFPWDETEEGGSFWSEQSENWIMFFEEFLYKYDNNEIKTKNYGRMLVRNIERYIN